MPGALPLLRILLQQWLFVMLLAAASALVAILRGIPTIPIPGLGQALNRLVDTAADWVEGKIHEHGVQSQRGVATTIAQVATTVSRWTASLGALAYATEVAVQHLVSRRLPDTARTATAPLARAVSSLRSSVDSALRRLTAVETRVRQLPGEIIQRVTVQLVQPLRARVGVLRHDHDVLADRVTRHAVRPLNQVIDVALPGIRARVGKLEREVRAIPVRQLLAGATAATSALALIRALGVTDTATARRCAPKLRGMCRTDPVAWQDLLDSMLPLAVAWSLTELVEQAQELAGDVLRAGRETGVLP